MIINHIMNLKNSGIDFIKVRFKNATTSTDAVKQYFSTKNHNIIIDVQDSGFIESMKENQKNNNKFAKYDYIFDPNLSEYEIFAKYVNQNKGEEFITSDELIKILTEVI